MFDRGVRTVVSLAVVFVAAILPPPNATVVARGILAARATDVAIRPAIPALPPVPSTSSPPPPAGVLTDGSVVLAISKVPKPAYFAPIAPEPFETRITRIAGDPGKVIRFLSGARGVWNVDARHHYSNDEPWNADQTLIAMDQNRGNPRLLFLDGSTYRPKFPACPSYHRRDDRWHPRLTTVRINAGERLLEWFDVVRCRQLKAWTLPIAVYYFGLTNGDTSQDGRFVVLGDRSGHMFVVDMVNNVVGPIGNYAYDGWRATGLGISPSGKFGWVHYSGDESRIFDVNPKTLAITPRPENGPICHGALANGSIYDLGHQDVALNPFDNDEDVMIGQEHCGNVGKLVAGQVLGHVVMVRLRDGAITSLTDPAREAYAYHVSGRATGRPGWTYVSYYERQDGLRFNQELISVKMDGSKAVERWGHLHTDTRNCYRCEAHPVPSRDGLRVIFASTWSISCGTRCGTQTIRQDYVADGRPRN